MKDKGKFVSVAGKISTWAYGRIVKILQKKGINIYQMIQNMCDVMIRYMDDEHRRTPEVESAMNTFEHMVGWKNNFTLSDPNTSPQIAEATYYLTDEGGRKGVRVVHVHRPFFNDWTQTYNVQDILERNIKLTFPQLYRRLKNIAADKDCNSILELLIEITNEMERETDKCELMQDFEDDQRSDYGKKPWAQPYKRRHNKTAETQEFNYNKNEI